MKIEVSHHGTLNLIQPLDAEALQWLTEHLDSSVMRWAVTAFVIEPRYLEAILEGYAAAGGDVQ